MKNTSIDMICFNSECIANNRQLFCYDGEDRIPHAAHCDDESVNIHPHSFNRKYAHQAETLKLVQQDLDQALGLIIAEMSDRFAAFLRQKLRQKAVDLYDSQLNEFRPTNCQNLLEKVRNNQSAEYQVKILNCLYLEDIEGMKKLAKVKMQKCQQNLTSYLQQLDVRFTKSLQEIIKTCDPNSSMIDTTTQIESNPKMEAEQHLKTQNEYLIDSQSLQVEKEVPVGVQKSKGQGQQNNPNHSNTIVPNNDIRKYFKPRKEKPIHKDKKIQNMIRKIYPMNSVLQLNSSQDEDQDSPFNFKDCTIRNQVDLVQAQQRPFSCQRLIVYYPLTQEQLTRIIRKITPSEVYLNYQIKLTTDFINHFPKQITKFCEFWDHQKFFDEVINRQHFPIDDFRHIKSVPKLHFQSQHWRINSKLSNAWFSNYYDLEQFRLSKRKASQIQSLRVQGCRCCNNLNPYTISQIFRTFKESSNLKTFILKCDTLSEDNIRLLKEFTLKNRNITCVAIEVQGKFIPKEILQSFSHLPLTMLAINSQRINEGDIVYMNIAPIIQIKTLKKLALTNMSFTTTQIQSNSSIDLNQCILDEQVCKEISELTSITFLDLFRCSPIDSAVVSDLSPKVKNRLYHLNLSHTFLDATIIPELQILPQLRELNLDRTSLDLKELFRQLAKRPLTTVNQLSLFNYNGDLLDEVDNSPGERTLVKFSELNNYEIDKIGVCFPNIEYLNIAFCRQFSNLSDSKFKKLKHLCSNKEFLSGGKIERMKYHRGIDVYLYDGVYPAWKIPEK